MLNNVRSLVRPTTTWLLVAAFIGSCFLEQLGLGVVPTRLGDAALMVLAFWFASRQKPEQAAR